METNIWDQFKKFVRESLTSKFKAFFPGCIMGLFGAKSLLFNGLPSEVVTLGAYCLKFVGTVLMAMGSGLGTAYGAYVIERYKEKKSPASRTQKGKRNKAA